MLTRCLQLAVVGLLLSMAGPAVAQPDGADIQIRDGTIVATAADYEMDGTMWTAFTRLEDSTAYVYRSTDHGLSWDYRSALGAWQEPLDRIGFVVGEGDSAFNYLFYLKKDNNGDLWVARRNTSSDSFWHSGLCRPRHHPRLRGLPRLHRLELLALRCGDEP